MISGGKITAKSGFGFSLIWSGQTLAKPVDCTLRRPRQLAQSWLQSLMLESVVGDSSLSNVSHKTALPSWINEFCDGSAPAQVKPSVGPRRKSLSQRQCHFDLLCCLNASHWRLRLRSLSSDPSKSLARTTKKALGPASDRHCPPITSLFVFFDDLWQFNVHGRL